MKNKEARVWHSLTRPWLRDNVGEPQLQFVLEKLHKWLFEVPGYFDKIRFRTAPSLIARSECELFAVSAPRFAARARFRDGSFANLRRTNFLLETVEHWETMENVGATSSAGASTIAYDTHRAKSTSPRTLLDQTSRRCLADSYFRPPARLLKKFHVITTELNRAYGENMYASPPEFHGVPFMQPIKLGGGVCAPAVAYMATALMPEYATTICRVSEIAALAQLQDVAAGGTMLLGGLSSHKISDYFARVGLRCALQTLPPMPLFAKSSTPPAWLAGSMFNRAMRAYLLSDIPVVTFTDMRRMGPIYEQLLRKADWEVTVPKGEKLRHHSMLLVVQSRIDARGVHCERPCDSAIP